MKTLFNTALVLGSVALLGACQTTANTELPTPCGLERTVCHDEVAAKPMKKKHMHKKASRLERTYSSAQSK